MDSSICTHLVLHRCGRYGRLGWLRSCQRLAAAACITVARRRSRRRRRRGCRADRRVHQHGHAALLLCGGGGDASVGSGVGGDDGDGEGGRCAGRRTCDGAPCKRLQLQRTNSVRTKWWQARATPHEAQELPPLRYSDNKNADNPVPPQLSTGLLGEYFWHTGRWTI
jgi:hypothetical protein